MVNLVNQKTFSFHHISSSGLYWSIVWIVQLRKFLSLFPCADILRYIQGPRSRGSGLYEHGIYHHIILFLLIFFALLCIVFTFLLFSVYFFYLIPIYFFATFLLQLLYLCSCPNSKEGVLRALSLVMGVEVSPSLCGGTITANTYIVFWCVLPAWQ